MKPLPFAFTATTIFLLIALFLAPQTRWLVRLQMFPGLIGGEQSRAAFVQSRAAFVQSRAAFVQSRAAFVQSRAAFVQSHWDDYPVQLAGQTDFGSQTPLQYARGLVARFPDSPSLRANILRYATQGEIHLARPEETLLQVSPPPPNPAGDYPGGHRNEPPTAAQAAAFDADASAGERLDPDNAYFPFMRAAGLFAAHRDDEGLAAIQRAGKAQRWQEYSVDEIEGRWRISEGLFGGREGLSRVTVAASQLFPHYQVLRATARLVTAKAVQEELAGHPQEGLALRVSLAHCGDLMRAQSTSMIGSLVGSAITAISRSRSGGAPAVSAPPDTPAEQWANQRLQLYCDYVTRLGHPEAARAARAQKDAAVQLRHLDVSSVIFGSRSLDFAFLGISLGVGWVLAANLLWLLLLGGLAQVFTRLAPFRDCLAPPLAVSLGSGAAILLVLGLLAAWQMHGAFSLTEALRNTLSPLEAGQGDGFSAQGPLLLGVLFGAVFPLLLLITFSASARRKRLPASVGLVEGFRDTAPRFACALAVVYCGLTLGTVHLENVVNTRLEQALHGEGQALAAQEGKLWPDVMR